MKKTCDLFLRAAFSCCAVLAFLVLVPGQLAADDIPARALTPPALPTQVFVGLSNLEIVEIDERRETFVIEANLHAQWQDSRLTFEPSQEMIAGQLPLRYKEATALELLETVWWPDFTLVDGRGSRERMQLSIDIYPDGTLVYQERFTSAIKQNLDLEPFPFDAHDISFSLGVFGTDSRAVVFLPFEEGTPPINWEPTEWSISESELVVLTGFACADSGEACGSDGDCAEGEVCVAGWPSANVQMSIGRVPNHYTWKIILPLTLIVLASSAVFWLDLAKFPDPGDRLTISFTGVLTVVAFDFVSSDSLPKLWYSTVLDNILVMAYVFMAVNIVLNVIATQFSAARPTACRRTDFVGRYVFPLAFLVGLWILIP